MPTTLIAITDQASEGLRGQRSVTIPHLPFKIGREKRLPGLEPEPSRGVASIKNFVERRLGTMPQLNDLYIVEWPNADGFHVSREHLLIDNVDGRHLVIDRGSACGTIVGSIPISIDAENYWTEIRNDDLLVVGGPRSPFRYRFSISAD